MIDFLKSNYKSIKSISTKINTLFITFLMNRMCSNLLIGENFAALGFMDVRLQKSSIINIGHDVLFRNRTIDNFVGIYKRSSICVLREAILNIGENTGFSNVSIFCSKKIIIGKYCNFGGNVSIWDTDFHPLDYIKRRNNDESSIISKPIFIGDDVFIGANCIVLKGVNIGNRSIIGAGSVVTGTIPPDEVWAGNPAKFIKKLN